MGFPDSKMADTVIIYPREGNSPHGPVFGVDYEESAYLEPGFKTITDSKGIEVISSLFGVFRAECPIKAGDELVWDNKRYKVISAYNLRRDGSTHHIEAYFGSVAE